MSRRLVQLIFIGVICLLTGIAMGRGREPQAPLLERLTTNNSIPKSYGRLVAVDRAGDSPVLYFEADDGTIRIVAANYGLNYGSLAFKAVTVPRN